MFKGAASTVIGRGEEDEPLYRHYVSLLDGGTKPNLAVPGTSPDRIHSPTLSLHYWLCVP